MSVVVKAALSENIIPGEASLLIIGGCVRSTIARRRGVGKE